MAIEQDAAELLASIRRGRPVVHHLANFVTISDVASATRALGAIPLMAMAPEEIEEILAQADVLVIDLGTPTAERLQTIDVAVRVARARAMPIVIDPVGAGESALRTEAAMKTISAAGLPVVRANAAEASALVGKAGRTRGVEAVSQHDVKAVALALAATGVVAAVTAPRDVVSNGRRMLTVDNGHPWLAAMPGAGCMATAVVGAFMAVAGRVDFVTATAAALACFGLAAERAARRAKGPGTLKPHLVDALFALTPADLRTGMRCTTVPIRHPSRRPQPVRHHR